MKTSTRKFFPWITPITLIIVYFFVHQQSSIMAKNAQIRALKSNIDYIETGKKEKDEQKKAMLRQIANELKVFEKIDKTNLWETVGNSRVETVVAITKSISGCDKLYDCVYNFIYNLKMELAKVDVYQHPADTFEDEEVRSKYKMLSQGFGSLDRRLHQESMHIIKNPLELRDFIEAYGDGIIAVMPGFTRTQIRHLFKEVKKMYAVSLDKNFQKDMRAFLALEAESSNPKSQKKAELQKHKMEARWKIYFKDQQAIYRHFSKKPEEWGDVIDLLETKI